MQVKYLPIPNYQYLSHTMEGISNFGSGFSIKPNYKLSSSCYDMGFFDVAIQNKFERTHKPINYL